VTFEPILNGVDFLDRAINELLEAHDQQGLKYAVLHLQATADILVKVRLQREGFKYVFEDPEQGRRGQVKRGDFKSVTLTSAVKRLDEVAEIKLTPKERRAFSNLGRERNKLQHFGSTSNREMVRNFAGKAMEVLSRFHRRLPSAGRTGRGASSSRACPGPDRVRATRDRRGLTSPAGAHRARA
jgi:hypothetical protein